LGGGEIVMAIRYGIALFIIASCSGPALSQPVITEAEFRKINAPLFAAPCYPIPLGRVVIRPMLGAYGRDQYEAVLALAKAGIIKISQAGREFPWQVLDSNPNSEADVNISLNTNIDKSDIEVRPQFTCLKAPPITIEKIVKIDPIKGGTTLKWDGSIVYLTFKREEGTLQFEAYSRNLPSVRQLGTHSKGRMLYKYDPFTSQWRQMIADFANINAAEFPTNRVKTALEKD
jgi:hypothetical protein